MKNTVKKIFLRSHKYALVFLCTVFLFGAFFCGAQTTSNSAQSQTNAPKQYYLLNVIWDSTNNTLKLKDGTNIGLTTTSLTKDSGSGSQFYAMIMDAQGQYEINIKTKTDKAYLGKWELPSGQKQGEIKITVPYAVTGVKLIIADAKTDKTVLEVDVSKLATAVSAAKTIKPAPVPVAAGLKMTQTSNKSAILGWVIIIISILVLGGGGYCLYRFYKKRKNAKALSAIQPPGAQNKL